MTEDHENVSSGRNEGGESTPPAKGGKESGGGISDGRYLTFVGGLLVLIIALLAILWVKERSRRVQAEVNVQTLSQHNRAMRNSIQQMMFTNAMNATRPVNRDDLSRARGMLDGRAVTLLRLSAKAGERIGFEPGDVIVVDKAPTSAPASVPGG